MSYQKIKETIAEFGSKSESYPIAYNMNEDEVKTTFEALESLHGEELKQELIFLLDNIGDKSHKSFKDSIIKYREILLTILSETKSNETK